MRMTVQSFRGGCVRGMRPAVWLACAVCIGASPRWVGAAIGFNFCGNRTDNRTAPIDPGEMNPLAPADVAGAPGYRYSHWNNLASDRNGVAGAVPSPLVDHLGQAVTGLSVMYDSPNTWDTASAPATPDGWMMRNYLDSTTTIGGQPFFRVDGIPYHKYSVVIYVDGDGTDGRVAEYWITDSAGRDLTPHRFLNDNANFGGTFIRVSNNATNAAGAIAGNFLVFDGLTNSTFRIRAEEVSGPLLRAPLNAVQIVPMEDTPENGALVLSPVSGYDTLTIAIHAQGTIQADLGWPFGVVDVPINTSDSEVAELGGTQPLHLEAAFNPLTHQCTPAGLEFMEGDIDVVNTLNFNLDLGSYLIIDLGNVVATASGIGGRLDTPRPLSRVSGESFPLADHELVLNQGTLSGYGTGLAANFLDPFSIDLAADPVQGSLGAGNGTVTVSSPTVVGTVATYTVTVEIPVNFSDLVMDDDPVDVTITATGTTRWRGTLTRHLPDWDGDGIIDALDPDDDNDQLPDTWETAYAMNPWYNLEAHLDPDVDRFTTLQEYIADTHPRDHTSYLWLRIESTADPAVRTLSFPSSSARRYRIESTGTLAAGDWGTENSNLPGVGGIMFMNRTNASSRAFYRVGASLP